MFHSMRRLALPTAALAIALSVVTWKYVRPGDDLHERRGTRRLNAGGTRNDRSDARDFGTWRNRLLARTRQLLAAGRIGDEDDDRFSPVRFEWAFGTAEAGVVGAALATEGIAVAGPGDVVDDRDVIITDKLESAGIHLDQAPRDDFASTPVSRYSGTATPHRLMNAIERTLDGTHSGLIIDTTMLPVVEIDEHREVGKGNVVLLLPSGSHVLRHGSVRLLLQALRDVSEGEASPDFARKSTSTGRAF